MFDFAHRLLLVELENGKEKKRQEFALDESTGPEKAARLKHLDVDVLICGAISKPLAYIMNNSGINLLPFVTGSAEEVLNAYLQGQLNRSEFTLPGFWSGSRDSFKKCRGSHHRNR